MNKQDRDFYEIFEKAKRLHALMPNHWDACIVGGAARDYYAKRVPNDIDIEIFGAPLEEISTWAERHHLKSDIIGKSFGIVSVTFEHEKFDLAVPRTEKLIGEPGHSNVQVTLDPSLTYLRAALRRDYTINSMSVQLPSMKVIDPIGGVWDINHRILRHVGPQYEEDPLARSLRGVRQASEHDLTLAPETRVMMRNMTKYAYLIPKEIDRVRDEWLKWARSKRPSRGLNILHATEWDARFPYIWDTTTINQDPLWHPEIVLAVHNQLAVDYASETAHVWGFDRERTSMIVLATLCHDFGKIAVAYRNGDSKDHSTPGTEMAREFLEFIGIQERIIAKVIPLVQEHMREVSATKRSVSRLADALYPATVEDWAVVTMADRFGRGHGACEEARPDWMGILETAYKVGVEKGRPEKIVKGRHLIEMGMKPGKIFSEIIDAAYSAQLEGMFESVDDGKAWVKTWAEENFCAL